jgi:hypothetical protein
VLRRDLQAAEQQLYALVELAEVHVAEAQVVEEIGIVWILAEELLQVDAGFIELAGGEELEGAGEGVGHVGISPNADGWLLLKWLFQVSPEGWNT